jgi:hypothetical protein
MKNWIQAVSVTLALAWAAGPVPSAAQDMVTLPTGTRLPLVFETTVSSASSHAGDLVVAKTRLHVRGARNEIVIPAGSEVRGHVVSADPGGKIKGRAKISVRFDRVVLRGEEHPMSSTSVALIAPSQAKRDAATVAAGTVGGAVVGGIVGGGKGARIGAVAGAGAGGAHVATTRGPQVSFRAGSRYTVRLTRSLRLPRPVTVPGGIRKES